MASNTLFEMPVLQIDFIFVDLFLKDFIYR